MTDVICSMEALVEAHRDRRLGQREASSVERHLVTCASCRAHIEELEHLRALAHDSVPPPHAAEIDHHRGRVKLLREAADQLVGVGRRDDGRATKIGVAAVAAVMLIAGGAALGRAFLSLPSAPPTSARDAEQRSFVASLRPAGAARYVRARESGIETVTLSSGSIEVALSPLPVGERFILRADGAEIAARGAGITRFVATAEAGELRSVEVKEGAVEVSVKGSVTVLSAGASLSYKP